MTNAFDQFDSSNAFDQFDAPKPVQQEPPIETTEKPSGLGSDVLNVSSELAAAFNKGLVDIADFFTTDQVNAILEISGSEKRIPAIKDLPGIKQGVTGGQMESGLGRDIVQSVGTVGSGFVGAPAKAAKLGADLPSIAAEESVGAIGKVKEFVSPIVDKIRSKFKGGATEKPYEDVAKALTKDKNIMPEIMADPDVLKAANDLGINVNPSVYSGSDIYREMENALKAIPGSKLSANEKETVRLLGNRADELITEWTGTIDKSAISQDFSERMLKTVKSMEDEASILYNQFEEVIPKSLKIQPKSTMGYIEKQIEDLGGIDNLDSKVARMYTQIKQEGGPTYALLDKLRKDVGSALKNQGPFKDASQNDLKQLYGTLTDDTLRGAEFFGLKDEVVIAKALVSDRKKLEESLQGALGKDLSKSLMAELGSGVKQLQKGQVAKFDKVMSSIPEAERQTIAISALNDIFAGGATKAKDFSLGGFVGSYESLMRNKAASNKLFQYIPDEVKGRMDSIYKVSKGLIEANKKDLNNPSGTARAVIGAMDAPNGIVSKLFNVGRQTAAGAAATSPFDMGVVGATAGFVNAIKSAKTKTTEAANEMLSSPAFQESMNRYIKGNKEAANNLLNNMKSTKKWLLSQSPEVKRMIARQGLIQYLTNEGEE